MTPQAVIYDIGNVLIEWNPERFYDATYGVDVRKQLFQAVDLHGMNDRIDAGALFKETIYELADRTPEWSGHIRRWYDNWIDMASPRIDHSLALLRRLRAKGVPVFALSNFGIHSFAFARTQYDFLGEFDRRYISGHMGVIKPDPEIYRQVEADCGIPPAALLFADDRIDNINAAKARGWQTHLFTEPQGWADRLVAAGLLTDDEARA